MKYHQVPPGKEMPKPARYVQPIHFEDFAGAQFERLVFAYLWRSEKWRSLEWYGQTGSDLGRDIWGVRENGESVCVQCVNRKGLKFAKAEEDIAKVLKAENGIPHTFRVVAASTISSRLRGKIKNHVLSLGVKVSENWSGPEFEEFLRHRAESLLRRFVGGEEFPDTPGDLRSITTTDTPSTLHSPSLVFVFGVPLGDNDSASWMMTLPHFGPNTAHSCKINFYDEDRINIQHQWLVAHPSSPYPPAELTGESRKQLYVAEASPEGSSGGFQWNPLNPDSQHYTINIDCRDGVFTEKWEVVRVDGVLRSRVTIERGANWIAKNPNQDPIVFKLEDPEFVSTPLATEVPNARPGKVVHPGWKPNHRFEVPAAILDPNGNLQIMSGIKLPDGSTLTDFGCWNILTRHFGDDPGEATTLSQKLEHLEVKGSIEHQSSNSAAEIQAAKAQSASRHSEARRFLAPELQRTIDRGLYIHGRAVANFVSHSADTKVKPTDLKQDFIPHWPKLYPNAPQIRDLAEEDAAALTAYYDSLHALNDDVNDWWGREGQLPVNLFNTFLHRASKCLRLALICIEKFELEALIPPPYESWGTISFRINQSLKSEEQVRNADLARSEANARK